MTAQFKAGLTLTTDAKGLVDGAKVAETWINKLGKAAAAAGQASSRAAAGHAKAGQETEVAAQAAKRLTGATQASAAAQSLNAAAAQAVTSAQTSAKVSILATSQATAAAANNLIKLNTANQASSSSAVAAARGLNTEAQAAKRAGEAARSAADHMKRLAAEKRAAERAANRLAVASHRASRGLKAQAESTSLASTALKALGGAVGAYTAVRFGQELFRTGLAAEALRTRFEAAMGGVAAGRTELEYVRGVAERLGLELLTSARSYASLAAAARGTALEGAGARQIFEAWASSATALGLSAADSERGLKALEQMISKGNVTAEELRQQMGDVLPGAFQTAAAAMGVTTQELNKMLEQGQVIATDFLPKFADALQDKFGDAATAAAKKANAEFNRFKTDLFDFRDAVAGGGFLDEITASMRALGETMSDPAFQQGAADLAAGVGSVTRFAAENSETIGLLVGSYVTYRAATAAAGLANRRLATTLVPMRAGFRLARAEATAGAAGLTGYRAAAIAAGTASRTAARGVRSLTVAMARNPFGLAAVAVTGLAASFLDLNSNIGRTDRLLKTTIEKLDLMIDAEDRLRKLGDRGDGKKLEDDVAKLRQEATDLKRDAEQITATLVQKHGTDFRAAIQSGLMDMTNHQKHLLHNDLKLIDQLEAKMAGLASNRKLQFEAEAQMLALSLAHPEARKKPVVAGGGVGKKPKANVFAEGIARYEQELADAQKLQRAGQISANYQQMVREEIEATTITRRLAQRARKDGFEITKTEEIELKALISQMLGEKRALQEGIDARRKAAQEAEKTARLHARTGQQIRSEIARLKPSYERDAAAAKRWRQDVLANLDQTAAGYAEFAADVEEIYQSRLHQAYQDDLERRTDWGAGVERVLAEVDRKNNDWASKAVETYRQVSQAAEDFFVGLITGKASVADFVNFTLEQFARLAFQQTVQPGLNSAFQGLSGMIAGMFGGGGAATPVSGQFVGGSAGLAAMHGGGMVGRDRSATLFVDPAIFAKASRYHGGGNVRYQGQIPGLRPGEVPIIAEENERVLTQLQQANTVASFRAMADSLSAAMTGMLAGGGGRQAGPPQVNINNYASDQVQVDSRQDSGGNMEFDIRPLADAVQGQIAADMGQGRGAVYQQLRASGLPPAGRHARTF